MPGSPKICSKITAPPISNGQPNVVTLSSHPAIDGPADDANERGTLVMLAAAGRKVDVVASIEVSLDEMIERVVHRRTCVAC